MQYAPKQSEFKNARKTNSGNRQPKPQRGAYKPKAAVEYQPKNPNEKDSTCSSSPSDAGQSQNSSVEREEKQGLNVLATTFDQQHRPSHQRDLSFYPTLQGGNNDKKFKSCVVGQGERKDSVDIKSEDQTNDETHKSDQFENQSDLFSVNKLTFEPSSALPSQCTSRRASVDSHLNLNNLKQKDPLNAPMFVPTAMNPSVAKPFKPSAAPFQPASSLASGLTSLNNINNDFTPSTPYVHKFRTEMCKNFELYGKCKYGDEVSSLYFIFTPFWALPEITAGVSTR